MLATLFVRRELRESRSWAAVWHCSVARESSPRGRKIETRRVFLVEPKSILPEHQDNLRDSRVGFRLQ